MMPIKSKKSGDKNPAVVPLQIQRWSNFFQHDIETMTSKNLTNAIIAIALGGTTFFLGSHLISAFTNLSNAIVVIFFILAYNVLSVLGTPILIKKGKMPEFWRYLKFVMILLMPLIVWIVIIQIMFFPEIFSLYVIFLFFVVSSYYLIYFTFRIYTVLICVEVIRILLIKTLSEKISIEQISKWYNEIFNYTFIDCIKIDNSIKVLPWGSSQD